MTDPLAPLHALADTGDLTTTPTDELYNRDLEIRQTLEQLPAVQTALARARQAIALELRDTRKLSWGAIAKGYGVSRTRIQQIVSGDTANAARRRARTQDDSEPGP